MARFVVERTFPHALDIPTTDAGAAACLNLVRNNTEERVSWVTSYVSRDRIKSYCVYDGPNPDAIRRAAIANDLPFDSVTEVRVLDPYFYTSATP